MCLFILFLNPKICLYYPSSAPPTSANYSRLFIIRELDVFITRVSLLNRAMNPPLAQIHHVFHIYIRLGAPFCYLSPSFLTLSSPIDKYILSVSAYLSCSPYLLCTQAGTCAHTPGRKKKNPRLFKLTLLSAPLL